MNTTKTIAIIIYSLFFLLSDCTTVPPISRAQEIDPSRSVEGISGIGFESQDIYSMTDKMIRDILSNPLFNNSKKPPRIIIDDTNFINESNQIFNVNLLLEKLRIDLIRCAGSRLDFVSRKNIDLVLKEYKLSIDGVTDFEKNRKEIKEIVGADYRLLGKISSLSTVSNSSGIRSNYYVFSFEILDLETGLSVWGNLYEVKKAGSDDTIYR